MQTVCQLDQDDTDVLGHSQKHFSQVFGLQFQLIGRIIQLTKLCDTVHQKSHLRSKLPGDLLVCHHGIFHHIMKDTGHNGLLIHLQICKYDAYTERVNNIRFSRFPQLSLMGVLRDLICFFDHTDIIRRMVFAYTGNQLIVELLRTGKVLHSLDAFFCFLDTLLFLFSRQCFAIHSLFSVRYSRLFICHRNR